MVHRDSESIDKLINILRITLNNHNFEFIKIYCCIHGLIGAKMIIDMYFQNKKCFIINTCTKPCCVVMPCIQHIKFQNREVLYILSQVTTLYMTFPLSLSLAFNLETSQTAPYSCLYCLDGVWHPY